MNSDLLTDPGIEVYKELILLNRYAMIIHTLRLSSRLLMLVLGISNFKRLCKSYFKENTPELFASEEGLKFAKFIKDIKVPHFTEILELEVAIIESKKKDIVIVKTFDHDISDIIKSLWEFKIPLCHIERSVEVSVLPSGLRIRFPNENKNISSVDVK